MENETDVTRDELDIANTIAFKIGSKWSLVDVEDLKSELVLWLFENNSHVARYRVEDGGKYKLIASLKRYAAKYCAKEYGERSGSGPELESKYSTYQVEQILFAMFQQPSDSGVLENPITGLPIGVVEVSPKLYDLILDVKVVFEELDKESQSLLTMRYGYEFTYRHIASAKKMSPTGVRKKIRRIIRHVQSSLND